jgi:hypothetical protein
MMDAHGHHTGRDGPLSREATATRKPSMNTRTRLRLSCLLLICALPRLAPADADSHRQVVEQLFRLTQMEQRVNEGVDSVLQIQLQQSPQLQPHRQVLADFLQKYIGWAGMKESITVMYLETFSEREVEEMNAFYMTPTGQRVINDVPQLVQRRNALAMQRMQDNIGELQAVISQQGEQ